MSLARLQLGFTLIELMIVVAIIGILAAVAIPAYQDYIGRAQAIEAVNLMAATKGPFSEHYHNNGVWPSTIASVTTSTTGKYTAGLSITAGAGVSNGGAITVEATYQTAGVNASIAGLTITLATADGGLSWDCTGGTLPAKFRPGACR
jgi:type IV pilus assembly protein PilA